MSPDTWADREIVEAICGGSPVADDALVFLLFELCGRQIRYLAHRFEYDEDDLRQDLCLHLLGKDSTWRVLRTWQGQSSLRTWIVAVATRICLNQKRKIVQGGMQFQPLSDSDGVSRDGSSSPQELEHDRKVRASQLFRAVDQLDSEAQKLMVLLHFIEERPIDEVAQMMQTTNGNASVIKHRALAKLRLLLEGGMDNVRASH